MTDMFYAKSPGNNGFIKNLEVLSFHEMDAQNGMFQMQLYKTSDNRYFLYGATFGGKRRGIMINEITDPYHPVFHKFFPVFDNQKYPTSTVPKLQIAEDLMIVAMCSGGLPDVKADLKQKSKQGIRI